MKNKSIQTEIDACYLYRKLAENESDEAVAKVFRQMSEIEQSHAEAFARKANIPTENLIRPSWRAKTLNLIGKIISYDYVLGAMMDTEKSLSNAIIKTKEKNKLEITGAETNHVKILWSIVEKDKDISGAQHAKFENRHRSVGGNAIRAAVLGGNDGLLSVFSLVMGVAGATGGNQGVLLAGIAGLLAGAMSMALGEWISVKSSQELYENQMAIEMEELETNPEGEQLELALIYIAKGIPEEQANFMAAETMKDKAHAHEVGQRRTWHKCRRIKRLSIRSGTLFISYVHSWRNHPGHSIYFHIRHPCNCIKHYIQYAGIIPDWRRHNTIYRKKYLVFWF
jgi:Uncharacterized membrane protein